MNVILLERIAKLGQMGDEVRVKNGYARNFLFPTGKALRATEANRTRFEKERVQLEARNLEARQEAEKIAERLDGQTFVVIRQAGETGQLYGSVSTADIAGILEEGGFTISRRQVRLDRPIKAIGLHKLVIQLHPEVEADINLNVARSQDEAERQARGEDMTVERDFDEPEEELDVPDLEEIFEQPETIAELEDADRVGTDETETDQPESDDEESTA